MLEKIINKRNYFMYINKITISINMLFFFYFMIHDSLEITMPLFFEKYKINIVYLGMLISISKILRSIIIIPLSNIRMNKKIKVLYFVLFTNILLNVFSIILRNVYLILFYFLFFLISTSVFNVIINPILAINTPEDKLGITFGIRDVFLYIGSFIGLLITGKIVDISNNYNNLSFMYIILFVFLILNLKSIQKLNGVNLSYSENKKDKHSASKLVNIFKIEKRFLYYIGVNTIIIIGTSSLTYMPLIGKEYGISDSGIYYIFSSSIFFTAFMSLIGGIIIDKFNKKKIYIVNVKVNTIMLKKGKIKMYKKIIKN